MLNLGKVQPGSTLYIPFDTFAGSTGAPITITGLATSDIQIYKDGGTTQRASASGITLLDTDGIDFDGITGIHGFSIDLADNTTADFYASGSKYFVVVSTITVDSQTMSFLAASFTIGEVGSILDTTIATLSSQTSFTLTSGPADNSALVGCVAVIHDAASAVQQAFGYVSAYTGSTKTVTLIADPGIFTMAAKDNISFMPPQKADLFQIRGTTQTARDIGASVLLSSGTGTGQVSLSSGLVDITQTAADKAWATATRALTDKAGFSLSAAGVQAIWDALTSALTTVGSIGKLLVDNINATISSRMATYTQPTGFLSATFPSGTIANTTNITAGTITTATNVTTVNDKTGYRLSATGVDDILDETATSVTGKPNTLRSLIWFVRKIWGNKRKNNKLTNHQIYYEDDGTTPMLDSVLTDDASEATREASS